MIGLRLAVHSDILWEQHDTVGYRTARLLECSQIRWPR